MSITRPSQSLCGEVLPVLQRMVRQGPPVLLLLFPDGSRRFVPVAWTDAGPDPVTAPRRRTLAPLQELLGARAIIDDLLQRLPAAKEIPNAPPADTSTGPSTAAAAVPRRPRHQWPCSPT